MLVISPWEGTYRECRFRKEGGQPLPADIMDDFTDQVIDLIGKGSSHNKWVTQGVCLTKNTKGVITTCKTDRVWAPLHMF